MTSTSQVHLQCLCGAISTPGTILAGQEIPVDAEICHCDSCRHTTGSLGISCIPLNSSPSEDTFSKLTAYHSSEKLTRYFCSTCGCHSFVVNHHRKLWDCYGGIIEVNPTSQSDDTVSRPENIIKVVQHDYVLDTVDGGMVPFLLNLNGRSIPTWSAAGPQLFSQPVPYDLPHATILSLLSQSSGSVTQPEENSYVPAKCRCGGVSLLIKRADFTAKNESLISPRTVPSDSTKYLTYFCACRSCRLTTGVSLTPWTTVPPLNVLNANALSTSNPVGGSTTSYDALPPIACGYDVSKPEVNVGLALKHHWSSPNVCRSFCGTCGATVSYWCGERPNELDLAVGILRSEDGSMARRWLEWAWGRCSFVEESVDHELSEAWTHSGELMGKS